jgi:hypothetical protein
VKAASPKAKRPKAAQGGPRAAVAVPERPKTIIEALDDPDLFGEMFADPAWDRWRVFLAALQARPLTDDQLAIFRHHTGRSEPPTTPSRYAQLVVGRRGGKSRILALIATYYACVLDHSQHIAPGETPVVAIIAKDRTQARVILNYIAGFACSIELFSELIEDQVAESIRFSNGVVVEVHTASIGAPRGRTFCLVAADEIAFWPTDGDSANPDIEVITAIRPGLSTIPYSLLLIASSPYAKRGILYQNYAKSFGRNDAPVLVWQGTSEEMNPTLVGDNLIAEMYSEDAERASAEFGAEFRSDIVQFITREAVESVTAHGLIELPPSSGIQYAAFTDPSGGSADSMTLAIGHCETSGLAVLDAIREVKPAFSPDSVVQEFCELLKTYGISRVVGDNYASEWPKERFATHGITYDVATMNKSLIYGSFLPALNSQRIRLLDSPRLIGQLVSLERRTRTGGKDTIDHPQGGRDDVANAVAGVLVGLIADRRPALVKPEQMAAPAHLTAWSPPLMAAYVSAFVVENKGIGATVYAALDQSQPNWLFVCDFDLEPVSGASFATIAAKLGELAVRCRTGSSAIWADERLLLFARSAGADAHPIPTDFRAEDRLLSVAGHVSSGTVKFTGQVVEKAKSSPFAGALNVRAGEDVDDPLRNALVTAIALCLDVEESRGPARWGFGRAA